MAPALAGVVAAIDRGTLRADVENVGIAGQDRPNQAVDAGQFEQPPAASAVVRAARAVLGADIDRAGELLASIAERIEAAEDDTE